MSIKLSVSIKKENTEYPLHPLFPRPVAMALFNKVAGNFIKKKLLPRFFPIDIAKFWRASLLKNVWQRLLLSISFDVWYLVLKKTRQSLFSLSQWKINIKNYNFQTFFKPLLFLLFAINPTKLLWGGSLTIPPGQVPPAQLPRWNPLQDNSPADLYLQENFP